MSRPVMTREIASGAAKDAGNRSMRKAGRKRWNEDDLQAVANEFDRLWPVEKEIEVSRAAFEAIKKEHSHVKDDTSK